MDVYAQTFLIVVGVLVVVGFFIKKVFAQHRCPQCESTNIRLVEQNLERLARHLDQPTPAGIQDRYIPIMKNHYECHVCHHKWAETKAD